MAQNHVSVEVEQPDAWHTHGAGEPAPQAEHGATQNFLVIGAVGVALIAVVLVTILGTVFYFRKHATQLRVERIETTTIAGDYVKYKAATQTTLAGFSWASPELAKEGARVSLPIDMAKQRVIEKYAGLSQKK